MEFNALKADVARGRIPTLLYLYGDNSREIERLIDACVRQLFSETDPQLNCNIFDAQTHSASEVVQAARTMPFAAARRLVVVRRADAFKAEQWKELAKYCARPSQACCLVLTAGKSSLTGALLKLFQEHGSPVACSNPRWERDIKAAVRRELDRRGLSAGSLAHNIIAETVGGDGWKLACEVEKIALYCRGQKMVTPEDVAEVLSAGHVSTIFTLVDGIGSGQVRECLRVLGRLANDGVHALQIMKMILRQFRLIAGAHDGLRRGLNDGAIAKELGLKAWPAGRIIKQARDWPERSLSCVFVELYQTQIALKKSRIDGRCILEVLICRLAALRNQPLD
jgi:DNA polymerase III subunit delta